MLKVELLDQGHFYEYIYLYNMVPSEMQVAAWKTGPFFTEM